MNSSANPPRTPPKWLFENVINPLMKAMLGSPFHGPLSSRLLLLQYTGVKSGRRYTTPVGYFQQEDGSLIAFSASRWWRNLRGGRPVRLRLRGQWRSATAEVVDDIEERLRLLGELIDRHGLATARQVPLGLPRDREPTAEDLRSVAETRAFVRFRLDHP